MSLSGLPSPSLPSAQLVPHLIIAVVQSLSCVRLFATPWTAAHQAPLSSTVSLSLLKFMSIESVMLANHLALSPFAFSLSQHQGLFQ